MLFPLSSFRFCSPLKNDGRGELRFGGTVNDFLYKKRKCLNRKPSPHTGTVAAEPSEGASVSRNEKIEISVAETKRRFLQNGTKYLPVILERT